MPPNPPKHRAQPRSGFTLPEVTGARELFWQNVVREMLTSLAMQRSNLAAKFAAEQRALAEQGKPLQEPGPLPGFDGRMAVVTKLGERIPIADIIPLFACSIGGTMTQRALSEDVQCTIFQIHTPNGEVYTFPIAEIRGVHALTDSAMKAMEEQAEQIAGSRGNGETPFGFAAFTSLTRELSDAEDEPNSEAAEHTTDNP